MKENQNKKEKRLQCTAKELSCGLHWFRRSDSENEGPTQIQRRSLRIPSQSGKDSSFFFSFSFRPENPTESELILSILN